MKPIVRFRIAIVVAATGIVIYWAWGSAARSIAAASYEPVAGLTAARYELDAYHCDDRGDSANALYDGCVRWTTPYDAPRADVAFYDRHHELFDQRAAQTTRERRGAAARASMQALAPALRKLALVVAIAIALMLVAPFALRDRVRSRE